MLNFNRMALGLFRQNCVLCACSTSRDGGVCIDCLAELPYTPLSSCPQCGLNSNGLICGKCLKAAPSFDATHAVFTYTFPIDAMLQRYKYANMLHLSHSFGRLLAQKINFDRIELVIPMPMHPTRLKERGFNQAIEIAKVLVNPKNKHKLDYNGVIRQKLTPPQASLPLKARVKNIKGAFAVDNQVATNLKGKRIAIVDDVMTSGASLNELANTLKKAGASHVECWVIARTLPHEN